MTVTNTGTLALPIKSIAFSGANSLQFSQTNNCLPSVAVAGICTINVLFAPIGWGSKTATLDVNAGDGAATQTITVTGTGIAGPFMVSPAALSFGTQVAGTASAAQAITVTNNGVIPLPIATISRSGANTAQFSETNNCQPSVAVGVPCTINVVFAPTGAGSKTATLDVNAGGGGGAQTVALTGTGLAGPYMVSPDALMFGTQAVGTPSAAQTVTVTNNGTIALPIASITRSGTNPGAVLRDQ